MRALFFVALILAAAFVVAAEPNQDTLSNFAKWLQSKNVHSKANLKNFADAGFGGVAREELKSEDAFVVVPEDALIRNANIIKELEGNAGVSGLFAFEPTMLYLIKQVSLGDESSWKAYIDVLPSLQQFASHPLLWNEAEKSELTGTGLDLTMEQLHQRLQQSFDITSNGLAEQFPDFLAADELTFERWIWSYLVCQTRMWSTEGDFVLAPLADMFNHDPAAHIGEFKEVDGHVTFTILAGKDYAQGEQLFASYGPKINFELLAEYGFLLPENPDDAMELNFGLKASNLVQSIVEPILRQVDPKYQTIRIAANKIPVTLLRIFRLSTMTFNDLERLSDALQGKPVSLTNELKAYRAAIRALTSLLQRYTTTVAEDAVLLEQQDLAQNVRTAIILRKSQKEIIRNNILIIGKLWEQILLDGKLMADVEIV